MEDEINKIIQELKNDKYIEEILKQIEFNIRVIDVIDILKSRLNKCQEKHIKIFGKKCCDDIKLEDKQNKYEDEPILSSEMNLYLKSIYDRAYINNKCAEYITNLENIINKCNENVLNEIISLKNRTEELIKNIKGNLKEKKVKEFEILIDKFEKEKLLENYDELLKIYNDLEIFNIEILGKIKIYVKLRPTNISNPKTDDGAYETYNKIIDIDNVDKKLKVKCTIKNNIKENNIEEKEYGSFNNICLTNNNDLFDMIKENFDWKQIRGKTTILFSYGISGSGKTYTMFNEKESDKGLIYHIYEKFNYKDIDSKDIGSKYTISIKEIFEHKMVDDTSDDTKNNDFIKIEGAKVEFEPTNLKGETIDIEVNKKQNIDNIISSITKIRIKNGTIKHTPNNDKSSRSHLFIVLEIEKIGKEKDAGKGYIVLCDSAGKELPIEIAKSYYSKNATDSQIFQGENNIKHPAYANIIISKLPIELVRECETVNCKEYINSKIKDKDLKIGEIEKKNFDNIKKINKYIQDIVKEGFFINESLNHMITYLDKNIKRKDICKKNKFYKDSSKCSVDEYNLRDDEKDVVYTFQEPMDSPDNIGTYTIFNKFKDLSKGNYRFIMIANSRTEEEKCNNIQNTFNFLNKIKST
jgi:hypothetical protein